MYKRQGYVYLTPEEVKSLLSGNAVSANPGCSGYDREMEAVELLPGQVMSVRWEGGVCYMMVTYSDDMRFTEEVQKMVREHEPVSYTHLLFGEKTLSKQSGKEAV